MYNPAEHRLSSQGGLSISEVAKCLGSGSRDLGRLCLHENINKWSRHKPVICSSVFDNKDGAGDSGTYGLTFNMPAQGGFAAIVENMGWDYTLRPDGNHWKRIGDFDGYDHDIDHFAQGLYNNAVTVESGNFAIVFNNSESEEGIPLDAVANGIAKAEGYQTSFRTRDSYVICMLRIENCSNEAVNGRWLKACEGGVGKAVGSNIGRLGTGGSETFYASGLPSVFEYLSSEETADCYVSFFLADRYAVAGNLVGRILSDNVELTDWERLNPSDTSMSLSGLFSYVIPIEGAVKKYILLNGQKQVSYYSFNMTDSDVRQITTVNSTMSLNATGEDRNGQGGHNTYKIEIRYFPVDGGTDMTFTTTNFDPAATTCFFSYPGTPVTYGKKYALTVTIWVMNGDTAILRYSNTALNNSGDFFTVTY